ncbi:MAG: hypothetical protein E6G96_20065 [Alphaproteobacteria bacterium]|nr:MAG: hypothetical protein E6G96_20065 [Alphaproteobacteria bacterium]
MLVFLSRCSNPKAVFAIPAGTERHRHSLKLGGQHGEEAKDEDEVSGEKGRAQDKAPEEEVRYRHFQSSTSIDVVDCVKRAGERSKSSERIATRFDTAGSGQARGRRRDRVSSFTARGSAIR